MAMVIISLMPPTKCADGKRRTQLMDYIDYLFPDPDIESLIAEACVPYPGVAQTLTVNGTTLTISLTLTGTE